MEIYADNAATTKMSRSTINAMTNCMEQIIGNPSSLHTAGKKAAAVMASARRTIAKHLGCTANELYFTSGGSESVNHALLSAAAIGGAKGKKHIVSTAFEHHAVLQTLKKLERQGFEVTLLDVHEEGLVTADDVSAAIRDDTCLVTVMFANNEIGTVQPIAGIGEACKRRGVLFHTDAIQAAGHLQIRLDALSVDMLSLSAHKFHGPKGVGLLFARKGVPLISMIEGGRQERGKRAGTENITGIVGMSAALGEACSHMAENSRKVITLRDRLIAGLEKTPRSFLNGSRTSRLPGNVSFCFDGIEGEALLLLLDRKGISVSSGSACMSGSLDPSHVLLAIGRPHGIAHGSLRLSLCHENTAEEADYIIEAVTDAVSRLREL